jgi:hypothetical protein
MTSAKHVCDVADCERGFDTIEEVVAHERTHADPICGKCGNRIHWEGGGWWHSAPVLSPAPAAMSAFAARLDADHEPVGPSEVDRSI